MPDFNQGAQSIEDKIKARALSLGFLSCGITTPEPMESHPHYLRWLQNGHHGEMKYLSSPYHQQSRRDPHLVMADVRSIISLAYQYPLHPLSALKEQDKALVAGYAVGIDYHIHMPALMDELIKYIRSIAGVNIRAARYTDSAPILERELAQRAGLGWIGKNSCVISPKHGSSFLLAEIFLDLGLVPDPPFEKDLCGTCRRCIEACPTGCINQDRTLNASDCISYHTIENKQHIPPEIAGSIGNWLFGCDVCQMVCPWNQKIKGETRGVTAINYSINELADILVLAQEDFEKRFYQSPILRSKWKGFMRNTLVVLSSSVPEIAIPMLQKFKRFTPDDDLLSLAEWSIKRLKENPPN